MGNSRYEVQFTRAATEDVKKLRPWSDRVMELVGRLRDDAYLGHSLTGRLSGARALEFTLRGVGACRAVYVVRENSNACIVFIVGSHENIYREAERRLDALRRSERSDYP